MALILRFEGQICKAIFKKVNRFAKKNY